MNSLDNMPRVLPTLLATTATNLCTSQHVSTYIICLFKSAFFPLGNLSVLKPKMAFDIKCLPIYLKASLECFYCLLCFLRRRLRLPGDVRNLVVSLFF
jgi:hypothetical protein